MNYNLDCMFSMHTQPSRLCIQASAIAVIHIDTHAYTPVVSISVVFQGQLYKSFAGNVVH